MRAARTPKSMPPSAIACGETAALEQSSPRAANNGRVLTAIVNPPSWATRARPKGMARVPTHAVRPAKERRRYARAKLCLPLLVKRVAGQRQRSTVNLQTTDISSSGVLFLSPQRIEPGTAIEIEVCLVSRPFGMGTVKMTTEAHIVRAEPASREGWHALAASFDDITFHREEPVLSRYHRQEAGVTGD